MPATYTPLDRDKAANPLPPLRPVLLLAFLSGAPPPDHPIYSIFLHVEGFPVSFTYTMYPPLAQCTDGPEIDGIIMIRLSHVADG